MCKTMSEYKYSSYNEFLKKKMIINDDSIELLFGKNKDYKNDFDFIHKIKCSDDFDFEDIKDKEITNLIKEFEKNHNKNIEEIKQDRNILKQFIQDARKETDTTLMELSEILDLSKSTIYNYCKK